MSPQKRLRNTPFWYHRGFLTSPLKCSGYSMSAICHPFGCGWHAQVHRHEASSTQLLKQILSHRHIDFNLMSYSLISQGSLGATTKELRAPRHVCVTISEMELLLAAVYLIDSGRSSHIHAHDRSIPSGARQQQPERKCVPGCICHPIQSPCATEAGIPNLRQQNVQGTEGTTASEITIRSGHREGHRSLLQQSSSSRESKSRSRGL